MEVLPFQSLPLGFRFRPTDVELIDHYLRLKINGNDEDVSAIREVDVCKVEPWDLPDLSMIKTTDREWFFFCPRDRKYPNGQRSNRATCAGYWKATGKDRKIVSRRLGLIGMKKTLVFHKGRAPMGQRTCWVIHEYRSTLRELDGTQPGQGAFVICRLFKKQEDDNEGSDCDEGETLVSSPNATNTSHEDLPSESGWVQESPVSGGQTEEQPPVKSDNCGVEVSDQTASYILPAPDYPSKNCNACDSEVQIKEIHEEDSNLDEALKYFYDPQEPPSPLHHMHMELVSAKMAPPLDYGFGNGYSGMQFQTAGYGKDPISDFLDSVLINPDDYPFEETEGQGAPFFESTLWNNNSISQRDLFIKESGSCSGSDMEGTQAQHDVAFVRHVSACSLDDKQGGNLHSMQDMAFADDGIFSDAALSRFCNLPHSFQEPSACSSELVDYNVNLESGIKIRTHLRRSYPTAPNLVEQGTAPRRICLHNVLECNTQDHEAEPTHTKASGLSTQDGENSCPGNELSGLMGVNVKLSSAFFTSLLKGYARMIRNVHIRSIGVSSQTVSSPSILGVAMVVGLFMVFIALCTQNTILVLGKLSL